MSTHTCLNCQQVFEGKYCPHCGQTAETHAINAHFLWHDIQHGLFHFDKGIPYTIKQLFTRPGYSVKEFLDGKRVRHFKPISLVIVLATVYGLLYHTFGIRELTNSLPQELHPTTNATAATGVHFHLNAPELQEWISTHYSWVSLLLLPLFALSTFIAFRKPRYNLVEHLVINAFTTAQSMVIHLVLFPLVYWGSPAVILIVAILMQVLEFVTRYWTYSQLFTYSRGKTFLLTILSLCYFMILFVLCAAIVVSLIGLFTGAFR